MKTIICLLLCVGIASGVSLPLKPNCATVFCTAVFLTCPDGTRAPVPANGCCPSLSACKGSIAITQPIRPISCAGTFCTMDLKICPDGTPAPIPAGECCPSLKACASIIASSRSGLLGSLGSNANLLQTLTSATHGTDLGTVLSILNLLNNIQQFTNDVHQIPVLINQTLSSLVSGAGQAGQIVVDQLIGSLTNQQNNGRDLLGSLGQNVNLLSNIGHLLPQGTSIATVISILNLLNNVNALSNDIHQIPVLLNQTLTTLVGGAGDASQIIVNQLLGLVGIQSQGRDLLGSLGQNANLLSSVGHLLPQGTSIATVISLLNLLNNVNALNNDLHQIPVVLQETITNLLNGVQNLLPPTLQPVRSA